MSGWAYMLRCSDGSYYVGSTSYDDIDNWIGEHSDGRFEGYTHERRPVTLVWAEQFGDLRDAQECERRIKGWRREKKEALIGKDWSALKFLAKRPSARRPSRLGSRSHLRVTRYFKFQQTHQIVILRCERSEPRRMTARSKEEIHEISALCDRYRSPLQQCR
jgi:putative endonuclease